MALFPGQDFLVEVVVLLSRLSFSLTKSLFKTVFFFLPFPYKNIENETILITGGGKGIGRLLVAEFAKHRPVQIIIWGRHEDTLQATCKAIQMQNVNCDYMVCDVSDHDMVMEKAKEIEEKFGNVTMLVNNAAVVYGNNILESNPEDMEHTVAVNTLGSMWTTKAFLPAMMKNNHGHVVNINSMLGLMGLGGAADYVASKHALSGFHDALCMEIDREDKHGIKVTSIHPYMVDTDMFSGVTIRFPFLFPYLDKNYVAWKSIDAVLTNQDRVIMPRIMYFLFFLKCILPIDALLMMQRFTGVHTAMDSFHGRQKAVKSE